MTKRPCAPIAPLCSNAAIAIEAPPGGLYGNESLTLLARDYIAQALLGCALRQETHSRGHKQVALNPCARNLAACRLYSWCLERLRNPALVDRHVPS